MLTRAPCSVAGVRKAPPRHDRAAEPGRPPALQLGEAALRLHSRRRRGLYTTVLTSRTSQYTGRPRNLPAHRTYSTRKAPGRLRPTGPRAKARPAQAHGPTGSGAGLTSFGGAA
jgi:hypothetical protein